MPPIHRRGLSPELEIDNADFLNIDLPGEAITDLPEAQVVEGPDGVTVDFAPQPAMPEVIPHDANLAELMDQVELNKLTSELFDAVQDDRNSNTEWEKEYIEGMKLLGTKIEDKTFPFPKACGVFDSLMLESVIRFQATYMAELFPATGPVKGAVIGAKTPQAEQQARRVAMFMNWFLTEKAEEYYDDRDRVGTWLPIVGSVFTKTYNDPVLGRPTSPPITPENLIVNYGATNIQTAPRVTHQFMMTRRDMKLHQLAGIYRDVKLGEPDETTDQTETQRATDRQAGIEPHIARLSHRYTLYEIHADLDIAGFEHLDPDGKPSGLPLPYRVVIEKDSRQCLAIYRNWNEGDFRYEKQQFFTHHKFVQGQGFYGWGFAHVMGGSAKARTSIIRQLIDAGTLNNFPGFIRVKGMRIENNSLLIGPGESVEIDTGGLPIEQGIKPLPYKEPSVVLFEFYKELGQLQQRLGATTEIAVGEGRQDAPVGTTTALLEAAMKPQSGIMKRQHRSLKREFKLLEKAIYLWLLAQPGQQFVFPVSGGEGVIRASDFDDRIDVLPVSDPNVTSSTQRMMRAESIQAVANGAREVHDMREVSRTSYRAMGLEDEEINRLVPPPAQAVPLDPVSENQIALTGGAIITEPWQDHDSHIQVHMPFIDQPVVMAHVKEHVAQRYRVQIEQALGQPLPPLGQQMPPEIQNQIAFAAARVTEQIKANIAAGEPNPLALAYEQIAVDKQGNEIKLQIARENNAVEAFKAGLQHTAKMADIASKEKQTELRVAADLAQPPPQPKGPPS